MIIIMEINGLDIVPLFSNVFLCFLDKVLFFTIADGK